MRFHDLSFFLQAEHQDEERKFQCDKSYQHNICTTGSDFDIEEEAMRRSIYPRRVRSAVSEEIANLVFNQE